MLDGTWQNPFNPRDVTGDGVVVPLDVLNSINEINNRVYIDASGQLPSRQQFPNAPFYDFNGDGKLSPVQDVLPIINAYNDDETPPVLAVGLHHDSGPGGTTNSDLLTRDPRLAGKLTDVTGISRLAAVVNGGPEQTVTLRADGSFQFDPGLPTDGSRDGEHRIRFVATDGRRNVSAPVEFTFQLDTAAPAAPTSLQLGPGSDTGSSPSDGITNDNTPTLQGDAPSGTVIQVTLDGQVVGQTTANSPWSVTTSPLPDGQQKLFVRAFDPAGNPSPPVELTVTIDTVAPGAPSGVGLDAASDTGVSSTDGVTRDNTPTIRGTAETGTTVIVLVDGVATAPRAGGDWELTTSVLADGQHTIVVTATDLAGNVSIASAPVQITIDTVAPNAPSGVRLDAASDTGISSTDGVTRDNTPTILGSAEAGATVQVTVAGQTLASAGGPDWNVTPATIADGDYQVVVTASDLAGNLSVPAHLNITIDTVAPPPPVNVRLEASSDTGASATDGVTRDNTPTVTGTAEAGTTVQIRVGQQSVGQTSGGDWQFTTSLLQDGTHAVTATATDAAGNVSGSSNTLTVVIDTVAPAAPASFRLSADSDTGRSATDRITNDATPTFIGTAEAGGTVILRAGAQVLGSTSSGTDWTITAPALSEGVHQVVAVVVDLAGNTSIPTAELAVTIDLTAPASPSGLKLTAESDTGKSSSDAVTRIVTPTIVGTAEAGSTVWIAIDGVAAGSVAGGAWQFVPAPLADGTRVVTATAEDLAGNRSATAAALQLTIDTQPPAPPAALRLDAASDLGWSQSDGITNDNTPTYRVQAETGALVRLFINGQVAASGTASSNLSLTTAVLADGTYTVHATTEDDAGNLSAPTDSITTVIDTIAPSAAAIELSATSDTAPRGDRRTSVGRVTLVGTSTANTRVRLKDRGLEGMAAATGAVQIPGVPLQLGDNPFTVETLDAAGNVATSEVLFKREQVVSGTDPVLRWNQASLEAIRRDAATPLIATRTLAMLHVAILDAVNNIDGTPSYYVKLDAPPEASAEAAVTAAAHRILSDAFPAQQSWFDLERTAALAEIPDGPAETAGVTFGRGIAEAILQIRQKDGWNDFVDYVPGTAAGAWQPTAPMFEVALYPQWSDLEPFAISAPGAFRPAGPPALHSAAYATALEEVRLLGSATSSLRTADQTAIARFWADGAGTFTPPGHWNTIASSAVSNQQQSLAENARLFAVLNIALADAGVAAWDAKYHFNLWRPIAAIRQADRDGNDQTTAESSWQPLLLTPPFPEYVSGHSTFSGAAAQILTHVLGPDVSFTSRSPGFLHADGVTPQQRSFTSFQAAAEEAGRSRIYGGIHYEFGNQDGLTTGRALADFVWNAFSTATDRVPPRILLSNLADGDVSKQNLTITGRVLDNLSGVQKLEVSFDGGTFAPVTFSADGSFSLLTNVALDGSADGSHRVKLRATDFQGNVTTTADRTWILDTQVPTVTITATPELGVLRGTVATGGSPIRTLQYQIDQGATVTIPLPSAQGEFQTSANLSRVAPGNHTVKVTAIDAAGLSHTATASFRLQDRIAFQITDHTPADGAHEVGATFRPQVFFSRPVDAATLTDQNFYATDASGAKLPATIVPGRDGNFAWLFFQEPLAGASTVTVHVDGATIAALDDGAGLDADGDGQAGGKRAYQFSTVSLAPVPGTSLVGRVVDPGLDLKPMTFDDIRPGPDGVLHTEDDQFLSPLAGVKVFLLGMENQFVLTDAEGRFRIDSVPAGNVKLAVDGRTATNVPAEIYFPEMVLDLNLAIGIENTVMAAMGTHAEMAANVGRSEIYLPRLQAEILQSVQGNQPTVVTVGPQGAPNLTDAQRQFLTLQVEPQSLIGPDGQPVVNGQVGVSTVPPELVRDMLPPGLLQHTFDITIQAPAAATFAVPLTLSLPNVFNAPPGTKLNFLTFDHTTGRLVIEGTGTVSADGLVVVTDPGMGITKPGWAGFIPPVTPIDPPKPPKDPCDGWDSDDTWSLVRALIDAGKQVANLGKILSTGLQVVSTVISLRNEISQLSTNLSNGTLSTADTIAALKVLNGTKSAAKDIYQTFTAQNPLTKTGDAALAAIKVANAVLDRIAARKNCIGRIAEGLVRAGQEVLTLGDRILSNALDLEKSLREAPLAAVCIVFDSLLARLGEGEGESQRDGEGESGLGRDELLAAMAEIIRESDVFIARNQPVLDALNGTTTATNDAYFGMETTLLTPLIVGTPSLRDAFWRVSDDQSETRGRTNPQGDFGTMPVIRPQSPYRFEIYDHQRNVLFVSTGTSSPSGVPTVLAPFTIVELADAGDLDGDGLVDLAEGVIGTDPRHRDTDRDAIGDRVEVDFGWDPLDGRGPPLGVVASLPLRGTAREVVLEGSFADPAGQLAYVATGDFGMAVVDTTKFFAPILLSQLDLPGDATDLSVDPRLQLAAVATGSGGLVTVDVSNPRALRRARITVPSAATEVEVVDGVAYVNAGGALRAYDLLTGTLLHELNLGTASIISIARERSLLYTLDTDRILRSVDISGPTMVQRDSLLLAFPASNVFVANGVAYVGSSDPTTGGLATIDVSNANDLRLIAPPSLTPVSANVVVATGSGQAIGVGTLGNNTQLQFLDVSNLANTGSVTRTFPLSGTLHDVTIGGGFSYVAAGSAGLLTVNYSLADVAGQPPTVDIGTDAIDLDPNRDGVQVLQGTTVALRTAIADDVQVRNVELLVDGQVVRNDVSFPFDFAAIALSQAGNGQVRVQIRATDTGGNVGLSRVLVLEPVADTTPPSLVSVTPNDGATRGQRSRTVQIQFSESMAAHALTAANVQLHAPGGVVVPPLNVQIRNDDRVIQLTYPTLEPGEHRIVVKRSALLDRAGNALGASDLTSTFTVTEQAVTWINPLGGDWHDPANWDTGMVPGPFDHVEIDVPDLITIVHSAGTSEIASLYSRNRFELTGGRLIVSGTLKVDDLFLIDGGTLQDATVQAGARGTAMTFGASFDSRLDGITVHGDLDLTRAGAVTRITNGLTLHGTAHVWGRDAHLLIEGNQTLSAGRIVINQVSNYYSTFPIIAAVTAGSTLILGENLTLAGQGDVGVSYPSFFNSTKVFPFGRIVNRGIVEANQPGQYLNADARKFLNEGTLRVDNAAYLSVDGVTGDLQSVEILNPDSELTLSGYGYVIQDGLQISPGQTVRLFGEWTNAAGSTISATRADVSLGSPGEAWANHGTIRLNESQTAVQGQVTLSTLNSLERQGGELHWQGVIDNRGQSLPLDVVAADWNGGTVEGGTIVSSNGQPVVLPSAPTGASWRLDSTVLATDLIVPAGVTLILEGDWSNTGRITADGGVVRLDGAFAPADIGNVETRNGGQIQVAGVLDNQGHTLQLTENAAWSLAGGTIRGGTIAIDPPQARFPVRTQGGTLDGVSVEGALSLADDYANVTIAGGTTFVAAYLTDDHAQIRFEPNQTLTGSIILEASSDPSCQYFCWQSRSIRLLDPNPSFTIAPSGSIRTAAGFKSSGRLFGDADEAVIENRGTIEIGEEANFTIAGRAVRNAGNLLVRGRLEIDGLTGNLNHVEATESSTLIVGGHDFVINEDLQPGNLRLSGTWTNQAVVTLARGGSLALNMDYGTNRLPWHNPGSFVLSGSHLDVAGTYTRADLDNIQRTQSTGTLSGVLDNSGQTLRIDEYLATWGDLNYYTTLTVRGGNLDAANDVWVVPAQTSIILDTVVLQTNTHVSERATLSLKGNWKNQGILTVGGELSLGGEVTTADLGSVRNHGGSVRVNGVIQNQNATLAFDRQNTVHASVSSQGVAAEDNSFDSFLSGNGRYVAFTSNASNLVPGDTNASSDVFVRDLQSGTTQRISVNAAGEQANGPSFRPAMSDDGRFVVFLSQATNLVPGDTSTEIDVFVYDRDTGAIERVNVSTAGEEATGGDAGGARISADGNLVVFHSAATNLVAGDTNGVADIFLRNRQAGTTQRISVGAGGAQANGESTLATLSADGQFVAFQSAASNLIAADNNGMVDIFVHHLGSGVTERVSRAKGAGEEADQPSWGASVSGNGRWVAFTSHASNLIAGDYNYNPDVFVFDRESGVTQRVSVTSDGSERYSPSESASISRDGQSVLFASRAGLAGNDWNGQVDVYLHHRPSGATRRISVDSQWNEGSGSNDLLQASGSWSADGERVAFVTGLAGLVPGDQNDKWDVFVFGTTATGVWTLSHDGELRGGTLKLGESSTLHFESQTTLDGVDVEGTLHLDDRAGSFKSLILENGTTYDAIRQSGYYAQVRIGRGQAITGPITLDGFGQQTISSLHPEDPLTITATGSIATTETFSGQLYLGGSTVQYFPPYNHGLRTLRIVNDGTISSSGSGSVRINARELVNTGTLRVTQGGELYVEHLSGNLETLAFGPGGGTVVLAGGPYVVNDPVQVPAGSHLTLMGEWSNTASITATGATLEVAGDSDSFGPLSLTDSTLILNGEFTLAHLANVQRSGGTVEFRGVLDNAGSTVSLNSLVNQWELAGGIIAGGTVQVSGDVTLPAGSDLTLRDVQVQGTIKVRDGTRLALEGDWIASGSILVQGGDLFLGGEFTPADLANIQRTGGHVNLSGVLDNRGNTLVWNNATGSWRLSGGVIRGGTLELRDNQSLVGTSSGGTLDGVVVQGGLTLSEPFAQVRIEGGTTFQTAILAGPLATLNFAANERITGSVLFDGADSSSRFINGEGRLTIESTGVLRTTTGFDGSVILGDDRTWLVNHGRIAAEAQNRQLWIFARNFVNTGRLEASNQGLLLVYPQTWSNTGVLKSVGGHLAFAGNYSSSDLAGLDRSGGTVELSGRIENTDATLALTATTGSLILQNAHLYGGSYTAAADTGLTFQGSNRLTAITAGGPLSITGGAQVIARHGLILNGSATIGDATSSGLLSFEGTQTLGGTGDIKFGGPLENRLGIQVAGTTLTIGPDIEVRAGANTTGRIGAQGYWWSEFGETHLIHQGLISADGGQITVESQWDSQHPKGGTFQNQGILEVKQAGSLEIANLVGPIGDVRLPAGTPDGSILSLDGTYTIDRPLITRPGSGLRLRGTWTNVAGNTIRVTDGLLELGSDEESWENRGVIEVTNTSTTYDGEFSTRTLGTLVRTGGTSTIAGKLDNTGSLLSLESLFGPVMLTGTIEGGTIQVDARLEVDGGILRNAVLTDDPTPDPMLPWVAGKLGNALMLDGDNDFAIVPVAPQLQLAAGDFTVEAWVQFNASSNGMMRIAEQAGTADGATDGWQLVRTSDNRIWFCLQQQACEGGQSTAARSSSTMQLDRWYHVAAVKSASGIALFIDGVQQDSRPLPAVVPPAHGDLRLGYRLQGKLDDVRVWKVARSASQIEANRAQELAGTEADLVAYWRWNESHGAVGADQTANDLDATVRFAEHSHLTLQQAVLDGVTLGTTAIVTSGSQATLRNGLTMSGGSLVVANAADRCCTTQVMVAGDQSIRGTGTIVLGSSSWMNASIRSRDLDDDLELESGITVRGGGRIELNGSLTQRGTILADQPEQSLMVVAHPLVNHGTIQVTDGTSLQLENLQNHGTVGGDQQGTLSLQGQWNNAGLVKVDQATLNLGGSFTLLNTGSMQRTGGTVNLTGTLDNRKLDLALVTRQSAARSLIPIDDVDATAWREPTFNDSSWTSGSATIGYDRNSPHVDGSQILTNVEAEMYNRNSTIYQRIPFQVDDPAALAGLVLKMKYNDGFVAFLNGVEVTRANFPSWSTLSWNSSTNWHHQEPDAETFDLSDHLHRLRPGTNVLAIHGLNARSADADFFLEPQLLTGLRANQPDFVLDASTGSWNLVGGQILGGTYRSRDGAKLEMTNRGGSLAGVTLASDLDFRDGAVVTVRGSLTLDQADIHLGNPLGTSHGGVFFQGVTSLDGTGEVIFGKHSSNFLTTYNPTFNDPEAGTWTIGSGITIRGSSGQLGEYYYDSRIINHGTILADDSGAQSTFAYDLPELGGTRLLSETAIDRSGVTDPAPEMVYQSGRTRGDFEYRLDGLTPAAQYTVRLHFAELYGYGAGDRKFDVLVNGQRLLQDFDIAATAGGSHRAVIRELPATADGTGTIRVAFQYSNGYPLVNALELKSGVSTLRAIDAGQEAGGTLTIQPQFHNRGVARARNAGRLQIRNLAGNAGDIDLDGDRSSLILDGAEYVLSQGITVEAGQAVVLNGTWGASGPLKVLGGTLSLGGSFTTADLAGLQNTAGTVHLTGTLENTGSTLALTSATGPIHLSQGTIQGGSYTASGTGKLIFTAAGGVLDGLTARSDLNLNEHPDAYAHIRGSLTLDNATIRLGDTIGQVPGGLFLANGASLLGTGTVLFGKSQSNYLNTSVERFGDPADSPVTIGPAITIRGTSGYLGDSHGPSRIIHQGSLIADGSGSVTGFDLDREFVSGHPSAIAVPIDRSGVTDPAPLAVYQTARSNSEFAYELTGLTPGTTYQLRLHFAELFDSAAGDRQFDVNAMGNRLLENFDVVAAAGKTRKAVVREFNLTADASGKISVSFTGVRGWPLLNALELKSGGTVVRTIDAGQEPGGQIDVQTQFVNQGTVKVAANEVLQIDRLIGQTGQLMLEGTNSRLELAGTGYVVSQPLVVAAGQSAVLNGTWSNTGKLQVQQGTLQLGGEFTTAGLGVLENTGGKVELLGRWNNNGATIALTPTTGPVHLHEGTIVGGDYTASGSGKLIFTQHGGTLQGLTARADLHVNGVSNAHASIQNGLTLDNAKIHLGSAAGAIYGGLYFVDANTVDGTGEIVFGKSDGNYLYTHNRSFENPSEAALQFGSGITLRGSSVIIGDSNRRAEVVLHGKLLADDSAAVSSFGFDRGWNNGHSLVTDATVDVSGVVDPAPHLVYQTSRTWGQFSYDLTGLTPNAAYTLRLHFAETSPDIQVGDRLFHIDINAARVLTDFDILAAAGARNKAIIREFAVTADLAGTVTVLADQGSKGQPLLNGLELKSGGTVVHAVDAGLIAGGRIHISAPIINLGQIESSPHENVIIDELLGNANHLRLIGPNTSLTVSGDTWVLNQGLEVGAGQTATLDGNWKNTGTLKLRGGTLNLDGDFKTADLGAIDNLNGTIYLTGTLDNTNATLALTASTGSLFLSGGTIQGGDYTASDGSKLVLTARAGALNAFTARGEIDAAQVPKAHAYVGESLTLDQSTVRLGNHINTVYGGLYFRDTASLTGTGEVLFGKNGSSFLSTYNTQGSGPGGVTIGPAITLRGSAGAIRDSYYASRFILQGTMLADDSGGATGFAYDHAFSGGGTFASQTAISTTGVADPAPLAVYDTARTGGAFDYTFRNLVPAATYTVRLHFVETVQTEPGGRQFHVDVNAARVLENFDILAEAGARNQVIVREVTGTADLDGNLVISFQSVNSGNPLVNALELISGVAVLDTIDAGQEAGGTFSIQTEFVNEGTVSAVSPVHLHFGSKLTNAGLLQAGAGTHWIVSGNYEQRASGTLAVALSGTSNEDIGRVSVSGVAALDGAFQATLVNGFVPVLNDAFVPLTYSGVSGQFSTSTLVGLPPGLAGVTAYNANDLTLTIGTALRGSRVKDRAAGLLPSEGLSPTAVEPLFVAARDRWCQADPAACDLLQHVQLVIRDLGDDYLGLAVRNQIWLDDDAAGMGWYLDPTPADDDDLDLDSDRYDLLSVLLHEMGHLLGAGHSHDESEHADEHTEPSVMDPFLQPGMQRRITARDLDAAFGSGQNWL